MNVSDAIITTYGQAALKSVLESPDGEKTLYRAFKRDCPNYPLRWGAWKLIVNSVKAKIMED